MYYKLAYPLKERGIKKPIGKTTILGRKNEIFVHTFQANNATEAKKHAQKHLKSAANDDVLGNGKITLREGISARPGHFQTTKNIPFTYK
ncbi:MAG: hypothetical protein WC842_00855 [Candidatus Paceibacterota bacterium]|jgi:hypothetical protein